MSTRTRTPAGTLTDPLRALIAARVRIPEGRPIHVPAQDDHVVVLLRVPAGRWAAVREVLLGEVREHGGALDAA